MATQRTRIILRSSAAVIAIVALCSGGAAIAADATTGDGATAPRVDTAPPAAPLPAPSADTGKREDAPRPELPPPSSDLTVPPSAPPAAGGKLEIEPGRPAPVQPPNLNVPPAPPPPQNQPGPGRATPPEERFEQHQEPPPRGQAPNALPRGEGAAAIPVERPTGIKAFEEWISSLFE